MEPINRKLLKENAKVSLKRNFWIVMLVCLVASLLGGDFNGMGNGRGSANFSSYSNNIQTQNFKFDDIQSFDDLKDLGKRNTIPQEELDKLEKDINDLFKNFNSDFEFKFNENTIDKDDIEELWEKALDSVFDFSDEKVVSAVFLSIAAILLLILVISVFSVCVNFLVGSFLGAPIGVGYRRFFMLNRLEKAKFKELFAAFGKHRYMKIVKTMFSANIRIWAWSLLFYFPGVVAYYRNFFVGYIMSENPNVSPERARELSRQMTDGHKWQMFVLDLSFIGWWLVYVLEVVLLTVISCGLLMAPAILLGYPLVGYQRATYAELYEERREYALLSGMASRGELIGYEQ